MGIKYLSGELKPAMPVYFPGWYVTGVVRIELDSTTPIKKVLVELRGKGRVWFNEKGKIHESDEVYIKKKVIVWRGEDTGGKMQEGGHELHFRIKLPQNIPSSFETRGGHVRYTITSRTVRDSCHLPTHSFQISVCTLYDLNTDPRARIPFSIEKSDSACILCCASGPVHFTLYSDRSGFVPGETMIVNGEVHNKSSSDVKSTHFEIIQVIVHKAGTESQDLFRPVQSVARGGIEGGRSMAWDNVQIGIPFVSPTNLDYCDIMGVSYLVKFSAKFGVCRDVSEEQPIIIGSIPLSAGPGSQPIIIGSIPLSAGPGSQTNMQAAPMPTSLQLCGVCGMGGETTVSHSGNVACNGRGPYEGLTLHVAPSLFQRTISCTGRNLAPVNVVYASQPARSSYF